MNHTKKDESVKIEFKCQQCGAIRAAGDLVVRKIFYRRRNELRSEEHKFCKNLMCGSVYQMALEG